MMSGLQPFIIEKADMLSFFDPDQTADMNFVVRCTVSSRFCVSLA